MLTVSIHAPVKGATGAEVSCAMADDVSIHAPVKGATRVERAGNGHQFVSIHAPVKGATTDLLRITASASFQSTRP